MKKMNKKSNYIANIQGLSLRDKAYCGAYGIVECYQTASANKYGHRMFKVTGSSEIRNGGGWTMKSLRKAIEG